MEQPNSQQACEESRTPAIPVLDDGEIVFAIRRADGSQEECRFDLLLTKLECERCEDKHKLGQVDGRLQATPEFLVDLTKHLEAMGLQRCTPTLAWKVWIATAEAVARLKKTDNATPT